MTHLTRRDVLVKSAGTIALVGLASCEKSRTEVDELDVTANEDLMREHGVLARLLGVYAACAQRIEAGDLGVLGTVRDAAQIARDFVESYHERMEELFVFPHFEAAHQQVELIATLRRQHEAGRELTDLNAQKARTPLSGDVDRALLVAALRGYGTMFEPHVAREDTIVFPLLKSLAKDSYAALGEVLERKEHEHFGGDGFEQFVAKLPALEIAAGVADLATFTVDARRLTSWDS